MFGCILQKYYSNSISKKLLPLQRIKTECFILVLTSEFSDYLMGEYVDMLNANSVKPVKLVLPLRSR